MIIPTWNARRRNWRLRKRLAPSARPLGQPRSHLPEGDFLGVWSTSRLWRFSGWITSVP